MVFRFDNLDEDDKATIRRSLEAGQTHRQIERLYNRFHILHLQHPGLWQQPSCAQLRLIGKTMREIWLAKLARDFPERAFELEMMEGSENDLMGYQIILCQPDDAQKIARAE